MSNDILMISQCLTAFFALRIPTPLLSSCLNCCCLLTINMFAYLQWTCAPKSAAFRSLQPPGIQERNTPCNLQGHKGLLGQFPCLARSSRWVASAVLASSWQIFQEKYKERCLLQALHSEENVQNHHTISYRDRTWKDLKRLRRHVASACKLREVTKRRPCFRTASGSILFLSELKLQEYHRTSDKMPSLRHCQRMPMGAIWSKDANGRHMAKGRFPAPAWKLGPRVYIYTSTYTYLVSRAGDSSFSFGCWNTLKWSKMHMFPSHGGKMAQGVGEVQDFGS